MTKNLPSFIKKLIDEIFSSSITLECKHFKFQIKVNLLPLEINHDFTRIDTYFNLIQSFDAEKIHKISYSYYMDTTFPPTRLKSNALIFIGFIISFQLPFHFFELAKLFTSTVLKW